MMWATEFGPSHEGRAAAVLADGSEPKPAVFDAGSSANMHRTSDWWVYDGTLGTPRASEVRAACSCGWRGERQVAIDWERVDPDAPDAYELAAPYSDWKQHIREVERRTVPVPTDVQDLLDQIWQRLTLLAKDAPLAALRAVAALEETLAETGRSSAVWAWQDEQDWGVIATKLGLSEDHSRALLRKYSRLY
ncbi:hypothetical protein ACIG3E_24620 [Streptomyces sp. NPDC053474]|uniref:hypothetical protein n=1 Tax=Streptomyces sp. NPDC053474 TaxID=3365704 RepID=UPI0037D817C0